jgi:hypothetical protein
MVHMPSIRTTTPAAGHMGEHVTDEQYGAVPGGTS